MYKKEKEKKYIVKHYWADNSYKLWSGVINNQEENKEHRDVWQLQTGFLQQKHESSAFNSMKLQAYVEHEQRTLSVQSLLWLHWKTTAVSESILLDAVLPFPPAGSGHWNKQYSHGQLGFVLESTRLFTAKRKWKKKPKPFAQKKMNA